MKLVIMAASAFGRAARRLLPEVVLVDPKPVGKRPDWPPPGCEDEWLRLREGFEQAFRDNGRRAIFDCRYLAATEKSRVIGLLQLPENTDGIGIRSAFSGATAGPGEILDLIPNRALAFERSRFPGLVAAVGGTDLICPRCANRDHARMNLGIDREESGRFRIIMLCLKCAEVWGDKYGG